MKQVAELLPEMDALIYLIAKGMCLLRGDKLMTSIV